MGIDKIQNYGINDLTNTPLWNLIQKELNSSNLQWENGKFNGDQGRTNIRDSKIAWIGSTHLRSQLFNMIDSYNKQTWNYKLDVCDVPQYGIYLNGGYYDWHVDEEPEVCHLMRKLSATIWLNDPDEYEGGEFDIEVRGPHDHSRYDSFKLPKGSIVVFPSNKWHRVRPVTSGVRKSLVTWFRGSPFK